MKKLMFMAVVAAASAASAAVCLKDQCGDDVGGTAYKVAISLKTTDIKSKTIKASDCDEPECAYWREQKTVKINGLLWKYLDDCACDWIDGSYSYAFWTKDGAVAVDEFAAGLGLIGKPDKKGYTKKIEAYGGLSGAQFGDLAWAGFGSVSQSTKTTDCVDECSLGVKSISGGIAGKLVAADFEGLCGDVCEAVEYEDCCDAGVLEFTAAYGTIKISYDKSTAKKVALAGDGASITDFFKVPSAAAGDIDDVSGTITIED